MHIVPGPARKVATSESMWSTDRLALRPWTEADIDSILRLLNDPLVQRGALSIARVVPRGPNFKETVCISFAVHKTLYAAHISAQRFELRWRNR